MLFFNDSATPWEPVADGVKRKILTYEPEMMLVRVDFETGGVGAVHRHVHTQMSYVVRGTFEITIGDAVKILRAGDAFNVPSNVWHGAVCVEAGELLDAFTPMREEFIGA